MLKYQLHKLSKGGKEARAVLLEDILTSDVFGLMAYFPYDVLLKPFLQQISLKNPESHFSAPDAKPTNIYFWKSFIWPESLPKLNRGSIEPDVVIEWPDVLLVVEAKFISPTDPEELLREYLVGFSEALPDKNFFLLLIDKNLSPPTVGNNLLPDRVTVLEYIQRRMRDLKLLDEFPKKQVRTSVLWLNWQRFYSLVEGFLNRDFQDEKRSIHQIQKNILRDLLEVLQRKGLTPFEPLLLEDFNKYEINLRALNGIGKMMQQAYTDLSDLYVDIDALGRTGLRISDFLPALSELEIYADDLNAYLSTEEN